MEGISAGNLLCFAFFAFSLLLIPAAFSLWCALLWSKIVTLVRRGRYITIHSYMYMHDLQVDMDVANLPADMYCLHVPTCT
jgi:hypothetical protein